MISIEIFSIFIVAHFLMCTRLQAAELNVTTEAELPRQINNTIVRILYREDPYEIDSDIYLNNATLLIDAGVIIRVATLSGDFKDIVARNGSTLELNGYIANKINLFCKTLMAENSFLKISHSSLSLELKLNQSKLEGENIEQTNNIWTFYASVSTISNIKLAYHSTFLIQYSDFSIEDSDRSEIELTFVTKFSKLNISSIKNKYLNLYVINKNQIKIDKSDFIRINFLVSYDQYNGILFSYDNPTERYEIPDSNSFIVVNQSQISLYKPDSIDDKVYDIVIENSNLLSENTILRSPIFSKFRWCKISNSIIDYSYKLIFYMLNNTSQLEFTDNTGNIEIEVNFPQSNISNYQVDISRNTFNSKLTISCSLISNINIRELRRNRFNQGLDFVNCFNVSLRENYFPRKLDSCSIASEPFIAELSTAPNNNSLGLRQIDAAENYWETTNFYEASLQICTNNGFTLYNEVKIAPLLNSSYQVVDINLNDTSFLVEPNLLNGFLKSDFILDARNTTTFYVNQSIIILPNVTFTIMAGTNIIFNTYKSSIFIFGRILIVKSPYNNSTRASLRRDDGYWNGLYVESVFQSGINSLEVTGCYNIDIKLKNQNGSFYSSDDSSFEFDQINFSASEIRLSTSGVTSVILSNSDISATEIFSVYTDKSSLIILNSNLKNDQDTFWNECGINDTSCRVLISNSTFVSFVSTKTYYIYVYSNNLTLVSSVFNGKVFLLYQSNFLQESLTVDSKKNSFTMFTTSPNELFTIRDHARSRLYFSENNFMSQGAVCNLYKYDLYGFDARFTIRNNTFNGFSIRAENFRDGDLRMDLIGNSFTNSEKVNFFQYGLIAGFFRNFNFRNNRLHNLENVNYLIAISMSYFYRDPTYTENIIEENDFENISQTTLISVNYRFYSSYIFPLNSSLIDLRINRNRFINTNSYIFDTNIEQSQLPNFSINATYNYWQSKSFLMIKSKSIRPDTNLLSLSILPFYEDSQLRILNNESIEGMFDSESVQIGGTLPQKLVRLSPLNPLLGRSYQIISSIIIPANYTLVIEAGVEINITAEDRLSFVCYGSLIVNGNSTHPVTINVKRNSLSDNEYNLIQFNAGSNEDSQSSLNYLVVNHESMSAGSTILLGYFKYPKLNNISIRQTQQNATTQRLEKNQGLRILSCKENSPFELTSLRISGLSTCLNVACSPINLKIINSYFVDCIRNAIYVLSQNVNITIDSTIFLSTNWSAKFNGASNQFLESYSGFSYLSLRNSKISTEWTSRPASLNVKSYEAILEKNSFENVIVQKSTNSDENQLINQSINQSNLFQFLSNSFTFNLAFDEAKITKYYYDSVCIKWLFANNQFYLSKSPRLFEISSFSAAVCSNPFLKIQNNSIYIQNNNTDQSQLLIFTYNLYDIDFTIKNNSFYYPAGFLLSSQRNQFFEFSGCSNLSINYNIFHIDAYEFPKDPIETRFLNCPFKSSAFMNPVKLLNARSNYFGAQTEFWLQTCSVPDDENHFDYYPTIKENGILDTLSRKLFDNGYFYGGFLTKNTFIDSSLSQNSSRCEFAVIGNILVPENVELTVDIGCTLRFRSNEGILVNGVLKSMGTNESPVRLTGDNWRGVRVFYEKAKFISKFTIIEKTLSSCALEYYKPNETTIRNVAINQSLRGILIRTCGNWIIDNVKIEKITYDALTIRPEYFLDSEYVKITNSSISNAFDIYIDSSYKLLSIFNSSFKNIYSFDFRYINAMNIEECKFDMVDYITVSRYSYDSCIKISITNNRFTNLKGFSIDMSNFCENMEAMSFVNNFLSGSTIFNRIAFWFGYTQACVNCSYLISGNYFNNIALLLNIADGIQVILSDNTYSVDMSAWMKITYYYYFYSIVELNVQQSCAVLNNTFVNSTYVNGLMVTTNQPLKKITILNNQFVDNFESVFFDSKSYNILLNSVSFCRLGNNLFVRSLGVDYDVGFTGALVQRTINGTSNYWNGLNTSVAIKNRIDLGGNSEIFLFEPFLNNASLLRPDLGSEFNCSAQNWCNEKGNCLADNYCLCSKGYKGDSCTQFDCPADCNKGNGNCTGPLTCTCRSGYSGSDCSIFSCQGNCHDRGKCISPDKCQCDRGWSETSFCLDCLPNFFGPNCLPLSLVYSAYPLKVESHVQGFIRLYGVNFINSDGWYRVYTCSYSNTDTSIAFSNTAQIVDDTQLLCELENGLFEKFFAGDDIDFRLVKNSEEVLFSDKLSIYNNCSTNACGEREPVKRGYCRYGSCVCLFPFDGPNCETRMYEPRFLLPSNWSSVIPVIEFSNFSLPVKLNETTTMPVEWQLTTAPIDMQLINNNSMLVWNHLTSTLLSNQVELKVSNKLGSGNLTFSVLIEPAYVVELADIAPKNVFVSAPLYILINITLKMAQNTSQDLRGALPVTLRLTKYLFNNTVTTKVYNDMNLKTLINGRLNYVFYPNRNEYGEFILEAMHPILKSSLNNVLPAFSRFNFTVLAISLNQSDISFTGFVNDTFESIVQLQNPNSIATLTNLSWNYATNEYVTIELFKFSSKPSETWTKVENNSTLQARLEAHEQVLFKIKLTPKLEGIYSNDYLEFKSKEGVRTSLFVYTSIKSRKPEITCNIYSFNFRMLNGTQKLLSFEVTNSGDLDSGSIAVNLVEPTKNAAQIRILETNLARFSNGSLVLNNLVINETKTIYFSVDVDSNQDEGFYSTQITIRNQFVYNSVGVTYFVSHSNDVQLAVLVQDEFTYYSPSSPLLANATVTLVNQAANYHHQIVSNSSGVALFTNLTENWYELQVQADRHSSMRLIWQPNTNMNYEAVFLQRQTVVITWTVKPVFYQDKYEIELEQTFETYVYAPVVVLTPLKIDVREFETTDFILFNVTNYGLIAAYNLTFEIPASFRNYEFRLADPSDHFFLELPANSSRTIRMNVFEKKDDSEANQKLLLGSSSNECNAFFKATYIYFCGKFLSQGSTAVIDGNCQSLPSGSGGSSGDSGVFFYGNGIGSARKLPNICNICWKAVAKCLLLEAVDFIIDKIPSKLGRRIIKDTYKLSSCIVENGECKLDVFDLLDLVDELVPKKKNVVVSFPPVVIVEAVIAFLSFIKCFLDESEHCPNAQNGAKAFLRQKTLQIEYKEDIVARISYVMLAINNQYQIAIETYGDLIWIDKTPNMWLTDNFFPCLSDLSEAGRLISSSESLVIGERATNDQFFESTGISPLELDALIERFNNTQRFTEGINLIDSPSSNSSNIMNMTRLGQLSRQYRLDMNVTASFGYANFYDWLDDLLKAYDNAPVRQNVCARIKLLISQTLMLTREGFEATLEIDNRESSQLTNISIQIQIFKSNGADEIMYNNLFSIGTPMLTGGLSGVNGDGTLSGQQTGSATWFLAPYREAANVTEQEYIVGGFLKYILDGKLLSYELDPQSITVRPEPRLNLFYFLEKYVQGDDPLTLGVTEPIEPFSLALMLVNRGYGTAMSLSMLTMQPKIIENEKGLLISFKLEDDAYMNNAMIKNSMNVSFGDVKPFEFRHVVWKFSSSLKGTFSNLSVTYTNKNPNGDPKLSLIDDIQYRQLYRLVNVDWPNTLNDSLPDFLAVEDFGSGLEMPYPNQLFMSNSNLTLFSVQFFPELFKIQQSSGNSLYFLNSFIETQLEQKISNASNGWFYTYVIIDPYLIGNDKISKITRIHDGLARPVNNFWTTYVDSETIKLSIFDYFSTFDNSKSRLDYFKNLSYKLETTKISSQEPPRFDRTTFEFNFTTNFSVSNNLSTTFVGQVEAISSYNNESLEYFLINGSSYFEMDRSDGRLSIKNSVISSLSNKSSLVVSAQVNDLATSPILSANCNVKINIIAAKKQNTLFAQILNALISWIFSLFRR